MNAELRALTSARGLAAWLVVLYHIRLSMPPVPAPLRAALDKGYLAVDFFFLLSGFVIWISWSERVQGGGIGAIGAFLRRRIARIWPLHLLMLGFGLALALLLHATGRATPQFPLSELPLHILLVQNWGFTSTLSWNDPAWSISCELGAYLLFPLLVLAIEWRRVPSGAVIGAIGALVLLLHAVFAASGAPNLGAEIPRMGLLRCLVEFACGTAIGALWLRWRFAGRKPARASLALAFAVLGSWLAGWLPETLALPAFFAALLLALALTSGQPRNPLEAAPLHYLGEVSYATYLAHFLLWFAFKLAAVDDAHAVAWPLIAAYLALVLLCSVVLYHRVERPAQRWINGLTITPRPRVPSPGSR